MTPQDEQRDDCQRYCQRHKLEAEVAQLRQDRRCVTHPEAERLNGCIECVASEICAARRKTEAAEAARDHLRARLRSHMEQWTAAADERERRADRRNDPCDDRAMELRDQAVGLRECAADLLAVLTEPPQQDIRENGPMNAIGPALDTKGETS